MGEGEISYAGTNVLGRARLAGEVIRERLGSEFNDMRVDLIGSTSPHGHSFDEHDPYEIRLRVAARASTAEKAMIIGEEVEARYLNGPAGGGGARKYVHEQVGIVSTLIDREKIRSAVTLGEWSTDAQTV